MASSNHQVRTNWRDVLHKLAGLLLADDADHPPTKGVAIVSGNGAPSGGYWFSGENVSVALYIRADASTASTALYVTVDGGTNWAAITVP